MPKFIAESNASGTVVVTDATASSDAVNLSTLTRTGIVDRSASLMTFDTGTRTLSIAATGTTFQYYVNNVRYTITGTSIVLPAATGSEQYVFFRSDGVLTQSATPWVISDPSTAPVSLVYWGMTGVSGTYADERHSAFRDRFLHRYLHNTRGTAYDYGLSGTFYGGTSGTFSFGSGRIWDEDINWDIAGPVTTARFWNRSGSAMRFQDGVTSAFSGGTATPQYDLNGTPTAVPNTNYFNSWFYATTEYTHSISIVMGQGQYASLAAAAAEPEPSIPGRSTREWKLLYQTIWRLQGGTTTFQSATDYRGASALPGQGSANQVPASQVTYIPSAPLSATSVQGALDQVGSIIMPAYGGMYFAAPIADSGSAGDPVFSLASGTWTSITATLSASHSSSNNNISASLSDGRLYTSVAGTYLVHCDTSFEINGNTAVHLSIHVTGTEVPGFSQAAEFQNGSSEELTTSAIMYLASGSYITAKLRASSAVNATLHHFNFYMHRMGE